MKTKDWFVDWFDSPYYHILYKNRNNVEAQQFICRLMDYLKPNENQTFLDAACGKGRHAIFIANMGFRVDGFDLSVNNIDKARLHETEKLKFYINDIRNSLKINHYDYVFNLFTSFGYFEHDDDNRKAIQSIADSLKPKGILVLDFLNANKVIQELKNTEVKVVDDVTFTIQKKWIDGFIVKNIEFEVDGSLHEFQEKVKALTLNQFKAYFSEANLAVEAIFGDYNLSSFNEEESDRLIIIARKN